MRGYYKVLPEDFLDENGYFRTKDGGWLDEAGYLHWTGRISGMIKTGGANVSPLEIESRPGGLSGHQGKRRRGRAASHPGGGDRAVRRAPAGRHDR